MISFYVYLFIFRYLISTVCGIGDLTADDAKKKMTNFNIFIFSLFSKCKNISHNLYK